MSLEQLERFCAHPAERSKQSTPFGQVFEGGYWSFGTDGRRMLAIAGRLADEREDVPNASHVLGVALSAPVLGEIDLAALAAFCGAPATPIECGTCLRGRVTCDDCDGAGYSLCECTCGHEHEAPCRECDGRGDRECPRCAGWRKLRSAGCRVVIGDSVFDRGLVAAALVDAARTSGTALLASSGDGRMMCLRGDGWAITIMPLANDGDLSRTAMPAFPLPVVTPGGAA